MKEGRDLCCGEKEVSAEATEGDRELRKTREMAQG